MSSGNQMKKKMLKKREWGAFKNFGEQFIFIFCYLKKINITRKSYERKAIANLEPP